jgi:hypothetical protein
MSYLDDFGWCNAALAVRVKLFAHEWSGVTPDIMMYAKG